MKKIITSLFAVAIASSQAAVTFTFNSAGISLGDVVDAHDGAGAQSSTQYSGTWTESTTGASGNWTLDVTDLSAADNLVFSNQLPSTQTLPTIPDGEGIQFVLDGTAGGNGPNRAIEFTFTYDFSGGLGTATAGDFGAAFAAGPNGDGFFDNNGGTLTSGGVVFDTPGGVTPNYIAATGAFTTSPNTTSASSSANHDYTIYFAGSNSVTFDGTINDVDTYVFGVGFVPVPEPSSSVLLGLGAAALLLRRNRK